MNLHRGWILGVLLIALFAVACGGSDPGVGTQTLYVEAVARTDGSTNGTSLRVTVRQGSNQGNFVSDANVVMTSDKGNEIILPWVGILGMGNYVKSDLVWEPGWRLRISRGADRVEAYLHAPGVTTITEPAANSTFNRSEGKPLVVRWKDESGRGAQTFEIATRSAEFNQARSEDPGLFQIDAAHLVGSAEERIAIERTSEVKLNGGVPGSTFKAVSRAEVNLVVE